MSAQQIPIDQLVVSPLNVRTNQEDASATEALEASIAAFGLLNPLVAHPLNEGGYGVLAGGRRLRALQAMVADDRLPADWPVPVIVRDLNPAEITELSLAENLLRRDLRAYEVHAAIAKAHAEGSSIKAIADHCGQRQDWVRQQLRLGELHPEIFALYAKGDLDIDLARAYGATGDRELQHAAFAHFKDQHRWNHTPEAVRAFLKVSDRELERLLALVGDVVYRAAGGRFELDLFADGPERGRLTDEALLRKLAEEKLTKIRDDIRMASGMGCDLRFIAAPPTHHGATDYALEILIDEAALKKGTLKLPPTGDNPAAIVAELVIDHDGRVTPRFWWESRKAMAAAERGSVKPKSAKRAEAIVDNEALGSSNMQSAQRARAEAKAEHGLTDAGLEICRSTRRTILRALLIEDAQSGGAIGQDYLTWATLRQTFGTERATEIGMRGLVTAYNAPDGIEPTDLVRDHVTETEAHQAVETAAREIAAHDCMTLKDLPQAFKAYRGATDRFKRLAAALVAGNALIRSANVAGWRVAVHDHIADILAADDASLREYWAPTAEFVGLFSKNHQLGYAQAFVDREAFSSWHKQKLPVITGAVTAVLNGGGGDAVSDAALGWLHPALSFNVPVSSAEPEHDIDPPKSDENGEANVSQMEPAQ